MAGEPLNYELFGHFDMPCGLRVSADNIARRVSEKGERVRLHSVKRSVISTGPPLGAGRTLNFFHVNPGEFRTFLAFGHEDPRFEDRLNLCLPFWELPQVPGFWLPVLGAMDLVLAPTRFVADAVSASLPDLPLVLVPQGVDIPEDIQPNRARFGLPSDAVVYGTSFSAEAVVERKNPWAAIKAFRTAFPSEPNVRLVVRASPGDMADPRPLWDTLAEYAEHDERVVIPEQKLSYRDVLSLYASLDVYLSLHRAEGLGLGMMESMMLGIPVVATGWSGNMDFTTTQNSLLVDYQLQPIDVDPKSPYGQRAMLTPVFWAEADIGDAAAKIRLLYDDPSLRLRLGEQAKLDMAERRTVVERADFVAQVREFYDAHPINRAEHRQKARALRGIERSARLRYPYYESLRLAGATLRKLGLR
jgi:glycosyltransferase involved in cell wall biosynthesis